MTNAIEHLDGSVLRSLSCVPADELPQYYASLGPELEQWSHSPKARVERLLVEGAGIFPDKLVIPRAIISASDLDAVGAYLADGIAARYSMGVRVVADRPLFGGARLPWAIGIDCEEKAGDFLAATLPGWRNKAQKDNYGISHLILMKNLPKLGTIEERPDQFVLRAQWNPFSEGVLAQSRFLMEMAIGTNRLRTLDRRMDRGTAHTIRFNGMFSPARAPKGAELGIGSWYLCSEGGEDECHVLKGPAGPLSLQNVDEKYAGIIHTVLGKISAMIIDPDIELLKRMDSLSDIGLNIIEFQGYTGPGPLNARMLIYGLRGSKDETATGLHTLISRSETAD